MSSLLFFLILTFHTSDSHVRLVCPRPMSPRSDITLRAEEDTTVHEKCTSKGNSNSNTADITEIQPGLFTIRFEETKFMSGAPFRVLLVQNPSNPEKRKNPSSPENTNGSQKQGTQTKRDTSEIQQNENGLNISQSQPSGGASDSFLNETFVTDDPSDAILVTTPLDAVLNKSVNESSVASDAVEDIIGKENSDTLIPTNFQNISIRNDTSETNNTSEMNDTDIDFDNNPEYMKVNQSHNLKESNETKEPHSCSIQSCLLLDHIPHNDHAIIRKNCTKSNNFPLGTCTESTYYITVRIPDVKCPDCLLVVQQVETDPDHIVCKFARDGESSDCLSYISCARVIVRPIKEGEHQDLSQCSNYLDNLPGNWPYRGQDLYMTDDKAVLTLDLKHRNFHVEVPEESPVGPVEKVEIRINSTVIWNSTDFTNQHSKAIKMLHMMWKNMPLKYLEALKRNELILNIIGNKQSKASEVLFKEQHFKAGHVTALYDIYSPSGWLVAPKFFGPQAEDPLAAFPAGDCAPVGRHFMSFFESVEGGNHGLLGMTVLENRAYITSVLHVQLGRVLSIRLIGSQLVGAKTIEIHAPPSFRGVIQTALDITQQLEFIDTAQFLKSVEVKTDRDNALMIGDLEEGFFSVLRDTAGEIKGMGAFQLTQGYWMRVEIVATEKPYLNHGESNQHLEETVSPLKKTSAEVITSHSQLLDLSKEAVYCHKQFCCLEAYVHALNSDLLLHFLNGKATLRVFGHTHSISGPILGPNDCSDSSGFCQMSQNLTKNNALSETRGGHVKAVMLPDRAQVLELSLLVNNPPVGWMEGKYSAKIIPPSRLTVTFPLTFSNISARTYLATASYPLSKAKHLMTPLSQAESVTYLKVTDGTHMLVNQKLPYFEERMCITSKIHVVGKDKSFWSPKSAPFEDLYAVVLDNVKFVFDNSTSLYFMDSLKSYVKCDFSKAKKLKILNKVRDVGLHFFAFKKPGLFYFADKHSCQSNRPAKLTVHVIKAEDNIVKDSSRGKWCRISVYKAWREKILAQWEGPSTSGSIILGLGLGLMIGFIFLLWQGIRMKQSPPRGGLGIGGRSSLSHFVRF